MATVLIVDDDANNRALVRTLLRYAGHTAVEAADGRAALERVLEQPPDLVICDILMPVMDGYEFVRVLRAQPALAHTQVVFYSATFMNEQAQELAERCGVHEVLVKPCEPEVILAAIERALARGAAVEAAPQPKGALTFAEQEFDRRHLRLVTDKLLAKVEELESTHQRLSALVGSAMDGIVGLDDAHRVVLFNPAAQAMFGWSRDDVLNQPFEQLLPEAAQRLVHAFDAGAEPQRVERLHGLRRDGTAFPLEASFAKTGDRTLRLTVILRDITERVQAEERIRRFARVAKLLSGINGLIVRVRQRAELFNESCRIAVREGGFLRAWIGVIVPETAGLALSAFCGRDGDDYDAHLGAVLTTERGVHPALARAFECDDVVAVNDLARDGFDWPLREVALSSGTQALAWLPLTTSRGPVGVLALHADAPGVFDAQELQLLRELASDMSFALEHLAQQEHLERLAFYDPLTGLSNEALLRERLGAQLALTAEHRQPLALVLVDLVHFKRINDAIGREAGDALLRAVAQRLRQCLGESRQLARIVADRFATVLADVDFGADLAATLGERHQHCFAAPFEVGGERLRVDARLGVAMYPRDGENAEALIRHAEVALKHAKASSERVVFHDARMSAAVAASLALENELRAALERDEFVLHYQPKVDVDTRRLTGLEALLRWQSPTRGLVPPLAFIGLLEETGLIVPVGLWALRRAAQEHRRWRECFGAAPSIAVNVSAVQLRREDFVNEVLDVLAAEGAGAGAIDLEVTESLLMEDVEDSIGKLQVLDAQDVCIAIDDFGTGYSSLAYLSKLPAKVLKIDRSFVAAMMTDPDAMTLVSTMISLAHSLRMQVVAEGVETEEQAKILRLLRCDQMQGYLVSRPVPQDEVAALLRPAG